MRKPTRSEPKAGQQPCRWSVGPAPPGSRERAVGCGQGARCGGLPVKPRVRRPRGLGLIIGSSSDPQFGPVLLFGQGGTAVEVRADRAVALPPLNAALARALIERTRVARLLHGWRDVPPADIDAVVGTLLAISQLLAREPRIAQIDINPLMCDAQGALALDARVRRSATGPGGPPPTCMCVRCAGVGVTGG